MKNPIFALAKEYGVEISISYNSDLNIYIMKISKAHIKYEMAFSSILDFMRAPESIYEYIEQEMIPPVLDEYDKWNKARIEKMKDDLAKMV